MSRALAILSLLPALALGQSSRPASPPPAGTAIAEAIGRLRKAKHLDRLTATRAYVGSNGDGPEDVLRLSGVESDAGLKLRLREVPLRTGAKYFELEFALDRADRLRGFEIRSGASRDPEVRLRARVSKQTLAVTLSPPGAKARSFEVGWSDDHVLTFFLLFFVPSLFDQGLPPRLTPRILRLPWLTPDHPAGLPPPTPVRRKGPDRSTGGAVRFLTRLGRKKVQVDVAASGPRKGRILEVRLGTSGLHRLVSPSKAKELEQDVGLLSNERQARKVLRNLVELQANYRGHGKYAETFEPLEAQAPWFARRLKGLEKSYLILLRAAPDRSKWMAIAVPTEPGKTGKRYFVVNQRGTVYQSETKLELDDRCVIPKGARPLE